MIFSWEGLLFVAWIITQIVYENNEKRGQRYGIKNFKFTVDNNFIIVYYKYKERFSYVRLFVC